MTASEAESLGSGRDSESSLELFTDGDERWTAVHAESTDERETDAWLSVADECLCELERWR